MKPIYIVALATLLNQPALSSETQTLDEYVITARPIGLQSIEHIAQPITVLRGEQLRKRQASTLGETLESIAGVTSNRFSPLASRPVIRGLSAPRVQILENGIGSMDVSAISTDHVVSIDPIQAEQIEIFRGPSALLYGSEAAGGFVNVVTNKIPETVPDSFSPALYTSYNTNSLENLIALQVDGGASNIAFHVDALDRDAKDYDAKTRQIKNSFYDVTNFNFGTSYIDNWGFLGMSYGRFNSMHGVPFDPDEPDELPFIDSEQDRIDLSGQIKNPISGIKTISLQGGYNNYEHTEFEDVGETGTVFDNEEFQGRIEIQHQPIWIFNGVFGTQFGSRTVSAVGEEAFLPKTDTDNIALFFLQESDINDNLHFEIGGRYEYQKSTPDSQLTSVSKNLYSIASGVHWHFTEDLALGVNISRSQRAPAAEELFSNGPHHATGTYEEGRPDLEIETANNIDLSLMQEQGRLKWKINLFVNYIENFIFQAEQDRDNDGIIDTEDGLRLIQYEQNDAIFHGFEATTRLNLYAGNNGQLDLDLFADYVRAELNNGGNLPRISPAKLGAGLEYQYNKLTTDIDFISVLAQKNNGALEEDTGGYTLLNLNASYNVLPQNKLNVFLKATNLLDEEGELHTSFIKQRAPIMGRAVMVGLQAKF